MINNSTTFHYELSIHAAAMLWQGIIDYHESTLLYFKEGSEDGDYCLFRKHTAIKEAKRLREFLISLPSHLVNVIIEDLDRLIEDMNNSKFEDMEI